MACPCQTGDRTLLLVAANLSTKFPEFADFQPGDGWELLPDIDAVQINVGRTRQFKTLAEVVNFLRTVIPADRLSQLKAAWSPGCVSIKEQIASLLDAKPILEMAPLDATPLLDILQHRRIDTWFQPIFNAGDLSLWGYECLMRGRDSQGQVVFPDKLISWARQENLLFMLDRICREKHIENAGAAGLPEHAKVLINFMPTAIYEPSFCLRTTMAAAERCGVDASRIIFEVVESEEVPDREHLKSILGYYRTHGFKVALDDVGAGYSGLMMLADLNPDLIKIDRALIQKAPQSRMHLGICRSLIELAHDCGKLALAEGVETAEERALLAGLGVDLFQGYHFARPSARIVTTPVELVAA